MVSRILYVPLDERPCNFDYPKRLFENRSDVEILTPPSKVLGLKKHPADIRGIRQFVLDNAEKVDAMVLSTEMLVYGGLLPSRIYDVDFDAPSVDEYIGFIQSVYQKSNETPIYMSNLIMRTPRYSSGDEEPEYYERFGSQIFRYGWLKDKSTRQDLSEIEKDEVNQLKHEIPQDIIDDYETRRSINIKINLANISLVEGGLVKGLVIPQDDSAEYGYTAIDQRKVYPTIKRKRLQNKVLTYPGADEAGYTLLARAFQDIFKQQRKIFVFFSSEIGRVQIPLYEDRPLCESLKSHILATGAIEADSPSEADIILAVNTSGAKMIEARDQLSSPDLTYDTFRNQPAFVANIAKYIKQGKKVAVGDSAYANGADLELINMLDEQNLLTKICAYRGWNTNCNTLGSTISTAIIEFDSTSEAMQHELIVSILDDGFYQSVIRDEITKQFLKDYDLTYFDLKDKSAIVAEEVQIRIDNLSKQYLANLLKTKEIRSKISFPWNRMFEVNCSYKKVEV